MTVSLDRPLFSVAYLIKPVLLSILNDKTNENVMDQNTGTFLS